MKKWGSGQGCEITRLIGGRSNVFLLECNGKRLLVDTSSFSAGKKLQKRLKAAGISSIDLLVLTHVHFDHASNALMIREKYGAKVIVHREEAELLSRGDQVMIRGTNFFTKFLINLAGQKYLRLIRYEPCPFDIVADDTLDLKPFGFNAYLLHTPGHTRGSMVLVTEGGMVLAGDTLFGIFRHSVFPPFAEDTKTLLESWKKLLDRGCMLFFPSHGSPRTRDDLQRAYDKRTLSGK